MYNSLLSRCAFNKTCPSIQKKCAIFLINWCYMTGEYCSIPFCFNTHNLFYFGATPLLIGMEYLWGDTKMKFKLLF